MHQVRLLLALDRSRTPVGRLPPNGILDLAEGGDRCSASRLNAETAMAREGKPKLEAGIYALCEVESETFRGTGASDQFWASGEGRKAGWPTVRIRYLRNDYGSPLTSERLRTEAPAITPLLLNGFQAAFFPIPAADFRVALRLLGEDADDLPTVRIWQARGFIQAITSAAQRS